MTIKEVAKIAGVSPAAVSRYMNGGSLSEEKSERIRKTIEETGYRPNYSAQVMRTGKLNQIGVIVPKIYSDSVSHIVAGITSVLRARNYMPLIGSTDESEEKEQDYLELMQNDMTAGIILMGTYWSKHAENIYRSCKCPLVITGQNFAGFPCVYHDDFNAVRELTSRVIAKGRKKIAYIGVTERDLAAGLARRKGAQKAVEEAGMDPACLIRAEAEFGAISGNEVMRKLLNAHPDIDGVVCATDSIALGAMQVLLEKGKRIPEEVSIVGVGDSWADSYTAPPLTTAHLYYEQCGTDAAKMLLHMIEDDEVGAPIRQTMLAYKIIERGSL